jgi:hypothetical protein
MTKHLLKTWYVTKWWNTQGILKVLGHVYDDKYVSYKPSGNKRDWYTRLVHLGKDVFATREEAEADVQKKAQRKIASLRKQLAKLEKEYPNV